MKKGSNPPPPSGANKPPPPPAPPGNGRHVQSQDQLTRGEMFLLEWQHSLAGGFYDALAHAITRADGGNLEKLGMGFPEEVGAFKRFRGKPGYWEAVKNKARRLGWRV